MRVDEYEPQIGSTMMDYGDGLTVCEWHSAARVSIVRGRTAAQLRMRAFYVWGTELPATMVLPMALTKPGAVVEMRVRREAIVRGDALFHGEPSVAAVEVQVLPAR